MVLEDILDWVSLGDTKRTSLDVDGIFHIATDVGSSRAENQDRVAVLRVSSKVTSFWCACLCDGMGGLENGGQAASLGLATFFSSLIANRRLSPEERLYVAIRSANETVAAAVPGGGSTLSAVCLEGGAMVTANVGDSRIFRMKRNGKLERLTTDDTMEEAYGSEGRGLLQYIGMKSGLVPHIQTVDGYDGQIFITSDGAHIVGEVALSSLRSNAPDKTAFSERVLDLANWLGGVDNATIVATDWIKLNEGTPSSRPSDVSVWSPQGRLKLSWRLLPQGDSPVQEPEPEQDERSKRERDQPQAKTRPPISGSSEASVQQAPGAVRSSKKKKRGQKKEQIEIGFSEEEQTD
ncbi:PP2C family protein-serine/threonine phosphatase [Rhizobium ruizarguesonis]|uniref:PP2C family protein-serine/threonine phosphatase n=1 Tax=Rhizobium ruizarguesonis TaxID=2081791 RepID=UPI0013EEBA16|nr:protein phosphatase 2C domain-containing protein [Rhizobium ruizarguesonis]